MASSVFPKFSSDVAKNILNIVISTWKSEEAPSSLILEALGFFSENFTYIDEVYHKGVDRFIFVRKSWRTC
jgi:hypothetical protein